MQLTILESRIIKLYQKGFYIYEIELKINSSQEIIEKILYMYRRLNDSNIAIEFKK